MNQYYFLEYAAMKFSFEKISLEELYKICFYTSGNYGFKGKSLHSIETSLKPARWRNNKSFDCAKAFSQSSRTFRQFIMVGEAINRCLKRHIRSCRSQIDALSGTCTEIRNYCDQHHIGGVVKSDLNRFKMHLLKLSKKQQLESWGTFALKDFKIVKDFEFSGVKQLCISSKDFEAFKHFMTLEETKKKWDPELLRRFLKEANVSDLKALKDNNLLQKVYETFQ